MHNAGGGTRVYGFSLGEMRIKEANYEQDFEEKKLSAPVCEDGYRLNNGECEEIPVLIEGVPSYSQVEYGGGIAREGCAITSIAMVFSYYGFMYTPVDIFNALGGSVFADWAGIIVNHGLSSKLFLAKNFANLSSEEIRDIVVFEINRKNPVILGSDWFDLGIVDKYGNHIYDSHWVVVTGYDSQGYYINNPSFGTSEYVLVNQPGREFQHVKVYNKL